MRVIDVQSDGSPVEIRVFDGDQQVARHIVRTVGRAGELVILAGGPYRQPTPPAGPPPDWEAGDDPT